MDISQLEDCFKNITVLYIKAYFQYTWVTDILAYFTILSKYTYQCDYIFKYNFSNISIFFFVYG